MTQSFSSQWSTMLVDTPLWGGANIGLLQAAHGLKLTMRLDDASDFSFSMPSYGPPLGEVPTSHHESLFTPFGGTPGDWEMRTDVKLYRDTGSGPVLMFRGRMGPGSDTGDGTTEVTDWTATSYKALLANRIITETDTQVFASQDVASIVWNLISTSQAKPGGALGITKGLNGYTVGGVANTGKNVAITLPAGTDLKSAIDLVLAGDSTSPVSANTGFDWTIDQNLQLQIWVRTTTYPGRGSNLGTLLDYRGSVASYQRTPNLDQFANVVRASSQVQTGFVAYNKATLGIATDPYGRIERNFAVTTVDTQTVAQQNSAVASFGAGTLYQLSQPHPSYQLVLKDGWWDNDFGIGDSVQVVIPSGRLNVNGPQRVFEMQFDIRDDGGEVVTVVTNRSIKTYAKAFGAILDQLRDLNLRR